MTLSPQAFSFPAFFTTCLLGSRCTDQYDRGQCKERENLKSLEIRNDFKERAPKSLFSLLYLISGLSTSTCKYFLCNPLSHLILKCQHDFCEFKKENRHKNTVNVEPREWDFIISISLSFPQSWPVLGGHLLCFFFTEPKQQLKGCSVLYRQQRKKWSMSQHYWPGDMGLSKDKLCWTDDQAYSKLCLASSAIWALKPNPASIQGQTSGLFQAVMLEWHSSVFIGI